MTKDDFLRLLESRCEDEHLDYKVSLDWNSGDKSEKAELVKDILAFANTRDGGRIIIGVEDGTFEPVGLDEGVLKSLDVTKVNAFLKSYTDRRTTAAFQSSITKASGSWSSTYPNLAASQSYARKTFFLRMADRFCRRAHSTLGMLLANQSG